MMYVVAYDIADDAGRARVAKVLERRGHRVQESVFECPVDAAGLQVILDEVRRVWPPGATEVRAYRVCQDCLRASVGLGEMGDEASAGPWVIV